ncbi:MAG: hypothetical protein P8K79_10310, partial [Mariniblastus sp.]|nr:hypothetical protein [Mariniblastus sp.]
MKRRPVTSDIRHLLGKLEPLWGHPTCWKEYLLLAFDPLCCWNHPFLRRGDRPMKYLFLVVLIGMLPVHSV